MCVCACVCVCVCVCVLTNAQTHRSRSWEDSLRSFPRLCAWVQSPLLFPSFPSTIQHPLLHLADGHLSFVTFILLAIPMLGPEIVSSRCHAGHQCGSGFYWLRSSPVASLVYESRQWASAREETVQNRFMYMYGGASGGALAHGRCWSCNVLVPLFVMTPIRSEDISWLEMWSRKEKEVLPAHTMADSDSSGWGFYSIRQFQDCQYTNH